MYLSSYWGRLKSNVHVFYIVLLFFNFFFKLKDGNVVVIESEASKV